MPKQSKVYKDFYGGRCTGIEKAKLPDSCLADMFNTMVKSDGTIDVMYQLKTHSTFTDDISSYSSDVDNNGGLYIFNHNRNIIDDRLTISSISSSSGTVYNTSTAHGLSVGDIVFHAGFTVNAHNGKKTITSVPSSTSYKTGDTNTTADSGYAYKLSGLDPVDGVDLLFADSNNKIHLLDIENNTVLKDFIDIGYSTATDTGIRYYTANNTLYVSSFNAQSSISGAKYKHTYIHNTICGVDTHDAWYLVNAATIQPEYSVISSYPSSFSYRYHDTVDTGSSTTTKLVSSELEDYGIGSSPTETYHIFYKDYDGYGIVSNDGFVDIVSQGASPYSITTNTLSINWNTVKQYLVLPPAGKGIGVNIYSTGGSVYDKDGTWDIGYYEFATTFVYVDGHESLPCRIPGGNKIEVTASNDVLAVLITASLPYRDDIVGSRVYYRSFNTSDEWKLFVDIDFAKGYRLTTYDEFSGGWHSIGTSGSDDFAELLTDSIYDTADRLIPVYDPSPETYRSINGYLQDENSIDIYYNTVTTGEGRAWFGDVITKDDNGNLVRYNDRLMYSPVGKYCIAPSSYYVDIVPSDGKAITAVQYYEGKILVFKGVNIYVIDVSQGNPANWYIEQQFNCGGDNLIKDNNIVVTDAGVVWACNTGCFIYSNGNISNLLYKRFGTEGGGNITVNTQADWETYVAAPTCRVGYDRNSRQIIVVGSYLTSTSNGAITYVYNVDTGTWSRGDTTYANPDITSTDKITNFVTTENSLLTVYSNNNASDGIYLKTWEYDTLNRYRDTYVYTKMDDFGFPGRIKHIYGIAVKYKAGNWTLEGDDITHSLRYRTIDSDGNLGSWQVLAFTLHNTSSYRYDIYKFSGTDILSAQALQVAVNVTANPNTAYYYSIAEIKIIYRPILKRAPTD